MNPEETEKSEAYESVWGDRYRDMYGTKVEAKVADLDTLYGGITVDKNRRRSPNTISSIKG